MTLLDTAVTREVADSLRNQAELLAEAFESPVAIWTRSPVGEWEELARLDWRGGGLEDGSAFDPDLAAEALDTRSVGTRTDANGRVRFAAALIDREGGDCVAVGWSDLGLEATAKKLAATKLGAHRTAAEFEELCEENTTFAVQLTSDLEELHFLRAMVDRLRDTAAAAELSGMARQTLPVLNETVRARCLAFLIAEDDLRPFEARVAYRIGETEPPDEALQEVIARLGAAAREAPLVRNWGGDDASVAAADADRVSGIDSLALAPLSSAGKLFGWLVAANRQPPSPSGAESSWQLASDEFGSGEATLMSTAASILAMHAANLEMLREKEQLIVSMVRALVSAIDSKDAYTRGHSERVALYTKRIAEQMGFFELEAEQIYLSGLLHDIGKIGVSDVTLNKPGRLTPEEFAEIAKHPDEGWAILCDLEQLRYVLPGVLHHHERWDGKGYPDGLTGEAIPLEGRVLAVADAYDAMTSDRAYRSGMPNEKAEAILRDGAGTQWDPTCVAAFFDCLDDVHRIQAEYTQRERRQRKANDDAAGA